jgi:hypothetical protein
MHSLDNCCKKKSHLSCKSFEVHGQGGNWTCTVCLPSFSQDWLFGLWWLQISKRFCPCPSSKIRPSRVIRRCRRELE